MVTSDHIRILETIRWVRSTEEAAAMGLMDHGFATGQEADRLLKSAFHASQVHGNAIVEDAAMQNGNQDQVEADGVYTKKSGQVLAIKTADCLPVLIRGENTASAEIIGFAVHAGWRGFCAGILGRAVQIAKSCNITPDKLSVLIGPAICSRHFEIGPEVLMALQKHLGSSTGLIASKGIADRWHADLQTGAALELVANGVLPAQITIVRQCTHEAAAIPSYRRDGKGCGRLVSWIRS